MVHGPLSIIHRRTVPKLAVHFSAHTAVRYGTLPSRGSHSSSLASCFLCCRQTDIRGRHNIFTRETATGYFLPLQLCLRPPMSPIKIVQLLSTKLWLLQVGQARGRVQNTRGMRQEATNQSQQLITRQTPPVPYFGLEVHY